MTEEPQDTQQEAAEAVDKQVADITNHPGWDRVEARLRASIDEYKTLRSADLAGLKLEEVGQRFLVARMVAEELESILTWVHSVDDMVRHSE